MSSNLFVVVLAVVVGGSSAQYNATCRGTVGAGMITPAHFFDVDKMMGTWHTHTLWVGQSEDVYVPEIRCATDEMARVEPLVISLTESYVNVSLGETITLNGEMRIDTTLPLQSTWSANFHGDMVQIVWVQTTYDNWAMAYECFVQPDGYRKETLILHVRDPTRQLDAHTLDILKVVAKGYGFLPENIIPIDNSSCS